MERGIRQRRLERSQLLGNANYDGITPMGNNLKVTDANFQTFNDVDVRVKNMKSIRPEVIKFGITQQTGRDIMARQGQFFLTSNPAAVENLERTLRSSLAAGGGSRGVYKSFSADRNGPFIVKASVAKNVRNPKLWLTAKTREALVHEKLRDSMIKAFAGRTVIPQLLFAGYNPSDNMFYHVMQSPAANVDNLISLDNLIDTNRLTREVYWSIESSIVRMWIMGALQGDTSQGTLLYNLEDGVTYVVDFDTVISLKPSLKEKIYLQWQGLYNSGEIVLDEYLRTLRTKDDVPYALDYIWEPSGRPLEMEIQAAAQKIFGRNTWLPDYHLLKLLWDARVVKPMIPLGSGMVARPSRIVDPFLAGRQAVQQIKKFRTKAEQMVGGVAWTRPVIRRLKTSSDPQQEGWSARQHGRSWTTIFFKALSGDSSAGFKPPPLPQVGQAGQTQSPLKMYEYSPETLRPEDYIGEENDVQVGDIDDVDDGNGVEGGDGYLDVTTAATEEEVPIDKELFSNKRFMKALVDTAVAKIEGNEMRLRPLIPNYNKLTKAEEAAKIAETKVEWVVGQVLEVLRSPRSPTNSAERHAIILADYGASPFDIDDVERFVASGKSAREDIRAAVVALLPVDPMASVWDRVDELLQQPDSKTRIEEWVSGDRIHAPAIETAEEANSRKAKEANSKDGERFYLASLVLTELQAAMSLAKETTWDDVDAAYNKIKLYESPGVWKGIKQKFGDDDQRFSLIAERLQKVVSLARVNDKVMGLVNKVRALLPPRQEMT